MRHACHEFVLRLDQGSQPLHRLASLPEGPDHVCRGAEGGNGLGFPVAFPGIVDETDCAGPTTIDEEGDAELGPDAVGFVSGSLRLGKITGSDEDGAAATEGGQQGGVVRIGPNSSVVAGGVCDTLLAGIVDEPVGEPPFRIVGVLRNVRVIGRRRLEEGGERNVEGLVVSAVQHRLGAAQERVLQTEASIQVIDEVFELLLVLLELAFQSCDVMERFLEAAVLDRDADLPG